MDGRISLTLSQLLVPVLFAFIMGMVGGASLVGGANRGGNEPTYVVKESSSSGNGWIIFLVILLIGIVFVAIRLG